MPGLGGGGAPPPQIRGWYKRRLPLITPPPGGGGGTATGVGSGVPRSLGGGVFVGPGALTLPHRAMVVLTRLPSPGPIQPTVKPPRVVRSDAYRNAVVWIGKPPPLAVPPPRPLPPLVARTDLRRNGSAFRTPLVAAKINVAGGVLPPWVVRRDYQRGGLVYRAVPFLKEPPPPVAGAVPRPLVVRWDYQRPALVYLERPLLAPPPPVLDGRTWISFYSEARQLGWFGWKRELTWEPDMATFLTKRTGETRQYAMDFSALPELTNGTLAGVSSVVSNVQTIGASNVTLTSPALGGNGKTATVWISGVQSGALYQIAFTVTVNDAKPTVLEEFGYLLVEDE